MGFLLSEYRITLSVKMNKVSPHLVKRLSILLLAVFLSLPASAQQLTPGDWSSDCDDDYCVFRKTLIFAGENSPFALFEILIDVSNGEASFVLTAPLGVALQPGVRITVEGQEWFAPLKVCYADGCRATVEISNADLALMLQRQTMELRYIPFGSDNPISASLPLNGLVAAISRTR